VAVGGVLLAPPIGREARAARRAFRQLAISLAERGFVVLRVDYDGTGDSSGGFNDPNRDTAWLNSVAEGALLLRSFGITTLSAVGMRLGATILGAASEPLGLTSLVLWDPCDSGRTFLRELSALEALRRAEFQIDSMGVVETSEYVFTPQTASDVRTLNLSTAPGSFAERTLVLAREDRSIFARFRERLAREHCEIESTDEQADLLDVRDPFDAKMPVVAIDRITEWLLAPESEHLAIEVTANRASARVVARPGNFPVCERFVQLGSQQLFGIVSEPEGEPHGPLILLLNVSNEEHIGPSRLWVELSRRWAGFGMRCARIDLRGIGDSPWSPESAAMPEFDARLITDVVEATRSLSPDRSSDVVLVGLCSGAYYAMEGALSLRAVGACAINPPVCLDVIHAAIRLETAKRAFWRAQSERLKRRMMKDRWRTLFAWSVGSKILPSKWRTNVIMELAKGQTDLLLLYCEKDISPYQRSPYFRTLDIRRIPTTNTRQIECVPGLDHSMHFAEGRARAVARIDAHILERFGDVPPEEVAGIEFLEAT
jgi:pimeloyl-ACP methyl ester carboxylesterase